MTTATARRPRIFSVTRFDGNPRQAHITSDHATVEEVLAASSTAVEGREIRVNGEIVSMGTVVRPDERIELHPLAENA